MADRDDHDEILRLRDRMHAAESRLIGLELLARELERWRRQAARKLEDLVKAEEIADAVAQKLDERETDKMTEGTLSLTKWQTRIAGGGFLLALGVAVAGGVKALIG